MPRSKPGRIGFNGYAGPRLGRAVFLVFFLRCLLTIYCFLVASALKTLWLLGAIDHKQQLTPAGKEMASFPLEPQHACAIVASKDFACTSEVLDIISIISASSKLFLDISDQREVVTEVRRKFRHPSGDHMTILNVVRAYREIATSEKKHARKEWCRKHFLNERTLLEARDIREQLVVTCGRVGIDPAASAKENEDPVIRSMGHGLAGNSAFIQPDGSYKQTMGQTVSFYGPFLFTFQTK